jgi:hypothetical protein
MLQMLVEPRGPARAMAITKFSCGFLSASKALLVRLKRNAPRSNPCELPLFSLIIELHFSIESIQKEADMRTKLIVLSLTAALIAVGGVAFEANATMGVGTESLLAPAKSYSLIETASCNGQGIVLPGGLYFAVQADVRLCTL